ncbi:HlyD family type I secretion periplasmic adaptor subunit [Hydrogenimonas urashimensis]|uniref:HlyD family type I secretion periplasmic adaptor subunit n=1 Tax=Hydrogenimonas urashimensis TaxID=2740515 RepID=UPI00191623B5|nr:HlyD family type I secretion periplasmic adaptor subunit [Hydrogenimonas urashimensis]
MAKRKEQLSERELAYLESLSQAVLHSTPRRSRIILYFWLVTVAAFLLWASIAKVDEIVRSQGKIVPSGENKTLQNLEGGIVEEILVKEGDAVKKGEVLLKIKNVKSKTELAGYLSKYNELAARASRLRAQAKNRPLTFDPVMRKAHPDLVAREKSLYEANMGRLAAQVETFKRQIRQKREQLKEARAKLKNLRHSYELIEEEVKMSEPMVKEGVKSRVDFLKLQREANAILTEIDSVKNSIPRIESAILEINSRIKEAKLDFRSKSEKEMNEALGEMERLTEKIKAFRDSVNRTLVRSPVDGLVKKLYVNTIGGVVKPGMDLVEIVPLDKNLIAEVKVSPKDIAFIYPGQKALVKFTAYDFAIYGGLSGKVVGISPDTVTDKKERTFYIVRIKTDKNFLFSNGKELKIIPGMVVNADIITGKRTILDYLLKPILNSKDYIFTEH